MHAALIERDKIINEEKKHIDKYEQVQRSQQQSQMQIKTQNDLFSLTSVESQRHTLDVGRKSIGFSITSKNRLAAFTPPNVMKNCQSDKAFLTLKLKIDKEMNSKNGQEQIDKKYEDFYFYRTYKNEERVQLKKHITDQTIKRLKMRSEKQTETLLEERRIYQSKFLEDLSLKMCKIKDKEDSEKLKEKDLKERSDKMKNIVKNHDEQVRSEFQQKYEELMYNSEKRDNKRQTALSKKRNQTRQKSELTQKVLQLVQTNRQKEEESMKSYREQLKKQIENKGTQAEERKSMILQFHETKSKDKKARYSEIYDAYEKGMKEIKDIFHLRLIEKKEIQKNKDKLKEDQHRQLEEKNRLQDWETQMNRRRVKKKQAYEQEQLQKKLKFYEDRVQKFRKEKDLIARRGHFNILVQEMRKQLLKETYREMEIKKKYDIELLSKIDQDYLEQFIDENDAKIDEEVLQTKYTKLFNLTSGYYKMFCL